MCFAKCTGLVSAAPLLSALTLRSEARVTEGERLVHGQEQRGETQRREPRVRTENLKAILAVTREENEICLQL